MAPPCHARHLLLQGGGRFASRLSVEQNLNPMTLLLVDLRLHAEGHCDIPLVVANRLTPPGCDDRQLGVARWLSFNGRFARGKREVARLWRRPLRSDDDLGSGVGAIGVLNDPVGADPSVHLPGAGGRQTTESHH